MEVPVAIPVARAGDEARRSPTREGTTRAGGKRGKGERVGVEIDAAPPAAKTGLLGRLVAAAAAEKEAETKAANKKTRAPRKRATASIDPAAIASAPPPPPHPRRDKTAALAAEAFAAESPPPFDEKKHLDETMAKLEGPEGKDAAVEVPLREDVVEAAKIAPAREDEDKGGGNNLAAAAAVLARRKERLASGGGEGGGAEGFARVAFEAAMRRRQSKVREAHEKLRADALRAVNAAADDETDREEEAAAAAAAAAAKTKKKTSFKSAVAKLGLAKKDDDASLRDVVLDAAAARAEEKEKEAIAEAARLEKKRERTIAMHGVLRSRARSRLGPRYDALLLGPRGADNNAKEEKPEGRWAKREREYWEGQDDDDDGGGGGGDETTTTPSLLGEKPSAFATRVRDRVAINKASASLEALRGDVVAKREREAAAITAAAKAEADDAARSADAAAVSKMRAKEDTDSEDERTASDASSPERRAGGDGDGDGDASCSDVDSSSDESVDPYAAFAQRANVKRRTEAQAAARMSTRPIAAAFEDAQWAKKKRAATCGTQTAQVDPFVDEVALSLYPIRATKVDVSDWAPPLAPLAAAAPPPPPPPPLALGAGAGSGTSSSVAPPPANAGLTRSSSTPALFATHDLEKELRAGAGANAGAGADGVAAAAADAAADPPPSPSESYWRDLDAAENARGVDVQVWESADEDDDDDDAADDDAADDDAGSEAAPEEEEEDDDDDAGSEASFMSEKVRKIEAKIRRVNDDAAAALKLETDAKAAEEEYEMKRRASAAMRAALAADQARALAASWTFRGAAYATVVGPKADRKLKRALTERFVSAIATEARIDSARVRVVGYAMEGNAPAGGGPLVVHVEVDMKPREGSRFAAAAADEDANEDEDEDSKEAVEARRARAAARWDDLRDLHAALYAVAANGVRGDAGENPKTAVAYDLGVGELVVKGTGARGEFPPPPPPPLVDMIEDELDMIEILSPPGSASPPRARRRRTSAATTESAKPPRLRASAASSRPSVERRASIGAVSEVPSDGTEYQQLIPSDDDEENDDEENDDEENDAGAGAADDVSVADSRASAAWEYKPMSALIGAVGGHWGRQRAFPPGERRYKAPTLEHAVNKLAEVSGAHAKHLLRRRDENGDTASEEDEDADADAGDDAGRRAERARAGLREHAAGDVARAASRRHVAARLAAGAMGDGLPSAGGDSRLNSGYRNPRAERLAARRATIDR